MAMSEMVCPTCNGKGSVQKIVIDDEDDQVVLWEFCETCKGSGEKSHDETFSLGSNDDI